MWCSLLTVPILFTVLSTIHSFPMERVNYWWDNTINLPKSLLSKVKRLTILHLKWGESNQANRFGKLWAPRSKVQSRPGGFKRTSSFIVLTYTESHKVNSVYNLQFRVCMKVATQMSYLSLIWHIITVKLGQFFLIIEKNYELDNSSEAGHLLPLTHIRCFLLCNKPPLEKEHGKLLIIYLCPDLK